MRKLRLRVKGVSKKVDGLYQKTEKVNIGTIQMFNEIARRRGLVLPSDVSMGYNRWEK